MWGEHFTHCAVGGVGAPQVGAGPRAVVGVVPLGLVDPPPVQVLAEVDVEPAHAAVLLHVAVGKHKARSATPGPVIAMVPSPCFATWIPNPRSGDFI